MMTRTLTTFLSSLLVVVAAATSAAGQQVAQPPKGAMRIRVHFRASPDSAYQLAAAALRAREYVISDSDSARTTLTTDVQYVAGIGLVEISATVLSDSAGSIVEVSGVYRRLRRMLVFFSAVSPDRQAITFGVGGPRELEAWSELAAIARDMGGDDVTYGRPLPR